MIYEEGKRGSLAISVSNDVVGSVTATATVMSMTSSELGLDSNTSLGIVVSQNARRQQNSTVWSHCALASIK